MPLSIIFGLFVKYFNINGFGKIKYGVVGVPRMPMCLSLALC